MPVSKFHSTTLTKRNACTEIYRLFLKIRKNACVFVVLRERSSGNAFYLDYQHWRAFTSQHEFLPPPPARLSVFHHHRHPFPVLRFSLSPLQSKKRYYNCLAVSTVFETGFFFLLLLFLLDHLIVSSLVVFPVYLFSTTPHLSV